MDTDTLQMDMKMSDDVGFDDADLDEHATEFNLLSSIKLAERGNFLSNGYIVRCELYENERYAPFLGFSPQNLLPTDRGAISTEDGLTSFSSRSDADAHLLLPGWKWDDDAWLVDADSSGWLHATDFYGPAGYSASNSGSAVLKHVHFVRRRIVSRSMKYYERLLDPEQDESSTDHHFDLQLVSELSAHLVEALRRVVPSAVREGWDLATHLAKKELVMFVLNMKLAGKLSVEIVTKELSRFIEDKTAGSVFHLLHPHGAAAKVPSEEQSVRLCEHFPAEEQAGLARLLIRRSDRDFSFHCGSALRCGNCAFAAVRCPHPGCGRLLSRKWRAEHDYDCAYKAVPCALQCPLSVPRGSMEQHVHAECVMRPVVCPFACVGCSKEGLLQRDLASHEQEAMAQHLAAAMERVHLLEASNRKADLHIEQLTAQIHAMHRR